MTLVLSIGLPLVVLGILLASAWYVPTRLATVLKRTPNWRWRGGWVLLVVASLTGLLAFATPASPVLGVLYVAAGLVFMAHIYLVLALLVLQAVPRRLRPTGRRHAGLAFAVAVGFTLLGAWQASTLAVEHRDLPVAGLAQPVTVMHISDVHLGHHRGAAFLAHIVEETNRAQPDLVVITGDLVDGNSALTPGVLTPLADFEAPVYFVTGNHETYIDLERALALIAAEGVRILHNERVATHGLQLVGLDYMNADDEAFDMHPVGNRTIKDELPRIPVTDDGPLVLLHHSPVGLAYVKAKGTALMLAGHTHAGQVFPGTVFAPFVFALNQGVYDYEGMPVFVSQGAGTFGPRMRLGSRNTIHVLRLTPP